MPLAGRSPPVDPESPAAVSMFTLSAAQIMLTHTSRRDAALGHRSRHVCDLPALTPGLRLSAKGSGAARRKEEADAIRDHAPSSTGAFPLA